MSDDCNDIDFVCGCLLCVLVRVALGGVGRGMRRRSQAAVAKFEIAGMFPALGVPVIRWPLLAGATHQHGEGYAELTPYNPRGRHPA